MDKDGVISQEESLAAEQLIRIENEDKKADQHRVMAWVSMFSMLIVTVLVFMPFIPNERLEALDNLITMFYIAQAGIVASFFGSSAYMTVNK